MYLMMQKCKNSKVIINSLVSPPIVSDLEERVTNCNIALYRNCHHCVDWAWTEKSKNQFTNVQLDTERLKMKTMTIIITCEAHMSNGKKNRNREGVDPLREQKILMIRNCDWYPRSSNEWWAKGKVYFADQNLWVGNEGQRRGMEKIAKEQRRYIWAKGRLKNTKFGTFFSSTPPPWRMISTTRSANPIFHYAQTSQQNIKRLLSIFFVLLLFFNFFWENR